MSKSTKIVIVGGGSAGWLTAGYLSKFHKDCEIELVESNTVPTIGVGESVTPHVDFFLTELGIDRHHWMKHTNSVYKLANKFTNEEIEIYKILQFSGTNIEPPSGFKYLSESLSSPL